MKKNLFIILLLIFVIPVVAFAEENYINYYGVEFSEHDYSTMLELGFSESEIYYMSVEEYNNNRDIEATLEATTTRYFVNIIRYDSTGRMISNSEMEVDEEEYNSETISMYGSGLIETTYKKMTTTISATGSNYRYKVSLVWKIMPATRSYDIIGIGIDNAKVYISGGSMVFNQNYCISNSCTNSSSYNSRSVSETGGGFSFKLPTSTSITTLSSYMYFTVLKESSSTLTSMNAYGDYSHATKSISANSSQGFYVTAGGVDLDDDIVSYYDTIERSIATWTGSW